MANLIGNKKRKGHKNGDLRSPIVNNQIIIGVLLLFGILFLSYNNTFGNVLGIISNKLFEIKNNTIQKAPTPTPELPVPCIIGKFSFDLLKTRCDSLQSYIEIQKQTDISTIQQLIDGLNAQIQKMNTPSNNVNQDEFKGQLEKVLGGCGGNESESHICKLNTLGTLLNIYGEERQKNHDILMQLYDQLDKYENYLLKIQLGGIGNGACSNHEGVDCSTSGNIGQVICADGWNQSQVYYFNVKECVEYTESTLSR